MNAFAQKIIHEKGKRHYSATLPKEIPRGPVGDCFDWCIVVALKFPQYEYVEGIVYNPIAKKWIYHAWLTDGTHAFDPTWKAVNDDGAEIPLHMMHYIGVQMDKTKVADFMRETEYKAVLKNYWRNKDLARAAVGLSTVSTLT